MRPKKEIRACYNGLCMETKLRALMRERYLGAWLLGESPVLLKGCT